MSMRDLRRLTKRSGKRRPSGRSDTDNRLLADVEHLAEVAAETIGRLHARGLADIARPLESALARLGRTR